MCLAQSRNIVCAFVALLLLVNGPDSNAQEKDSLRLYKGLKRAAYKYRVTTLVYNALFRDPEPKEYPVQPAVPLKEKHVNPYMLYPGKHIRKINVTVLDPFGYSINDTTPPKTDFIQKAGNRLHITTRRWIVLNRLLFRENDTINPLVISESERVLRQAAFINDARIFISPTSSRDSVDVNVIVHDKWPVTIPLMVTPDAGDARIRNTNFLGLGQQFEEYILVRRPGYYEHNGSYSIANIDRTFISSRAGYIWKPGFTNVSLTFDRPFYSPLAKWAGGLATYHSWQFHPYFDSIQKVNKPQRVNLFGYDVYMAKNFKFSRSMSFSNQSTNLTVGLRHFNNLFLGRPGFEYDTARTYRNWSAVLGNVGVGIQQYYKDKYIYRFGANEDVPEGLLMQFIYGGYRREYGKLRYYNGFEVARSKHFGFGYLAATLSYGVFYNQGVPNDVTTNLKMNYFSELLRAGDWYFREFVYYTFVHGENKIGNEKITLRPEEMYGFDNTTLVGNTKMLLSSETVAYMPYDLVGFKFAPVFIAGLGMIGDGEKPMSTRRVFQGYVIGLMIRNENLLVNTFQVSYAFYPLLPDGRVNRFVYNPVGSFSVKLRSFWMTRPDFVPYY